MRKIPFFLSLLLIFILINLISCTSSPITPKPRGFHRIILPDSHNYKKFIGTNCPFSFEYPDFGVVDNSRMDSCWVTIDYPKFNCKWHITYKEITPKANYSLSFEDHRRLIYKHSQKAIEITETILKAKKSRGVMYEIYGEVPTSVQFFYSDSIKHSLMTSFYFNTATKNDSLQPIISYMKKDLTHMIETIEWK